MLCLCEKRYCVSEAQGYTGWNGVVLPQCRGLVECEEGQCWTVALQGSRYVRPVYVVPAHGSEICRGMPPGFVETHVYGAIALVHVMTVLLGSVAVLTMGFW